MSKKLSVIGTVISLLTGLFVGPLSAPAYASECLSAPGESAPGRHWFYWTDKVSKQRCWFANEAAERTARYRSEDDSSLRNQNSGGYQQPLPIAPTEAESPVKSWFSSNFPAWNGWGSRTEAEEAAPTEAMLLRKRSEDARKHVKTSQQTKQKHKSERRVSERTKQKAAHRVAQVPEPAGHKDGPVATFEFDKNWQNAMDAVREKDVLTGRTEVEDWQKALYEEFLVWRTKQIMFGYGD
jgi:hypothetical protein